MTGPRLGYLVVPLVGYHGFLLLGGLLLVLGDERGSGFELASGVALIATGVAVDVILIAWTRRKLLISARGAASLEATAGRVAQAGARMCVACASRGSGLICRRCGRPMVPTRVRPGDPSGAAG
ncbi:MAG TPA: hypothetical protein VEY07_02945 [Thermoplasmata archaeon]|nr:hypothetical protein [Thermoplasmata archaeon]